MAHNDMANPKIKKIVEQHSIQLSELEELPSNQEFLYVISFGENYYKIGVTRNLPQRFKQFQIGNPFVKNENQLIAVCIQKQPEDRKSEVFVVNTWGGSTTAYSNPTMRYQEREVHKWCIERGYNYDLLKEGDTKKRLMSETFVMPPKGLKDMLDFIGMNSVMIAREQINKILWGNAGHRYHNSWKPLERLN